MSSPLSSLRKSKKSPFPGGIDKDNRNKWVPYRESSFSANENKLLDEVTSDITKSRLKDLSSLNNNGSAGLQKKTNMKSKTSSATEKTAATTDSDLMSLMMARLSQLELRLQFQTKEITEKDKKIRILEEKVKLLNKAKDINKSPGYVQDLEKKYLLLQEENQEMERFLADYGMMWVGESSNTDADVYHEDSDDDTETTERPLWYRESSFVAPGFQMDYDLVIKNIDDLNALAGEGIAQIQRTSGGAKLKIPDAINLTLYANGIVMFSGPFRSLEEPSTQECLKDIMDGYFPNELQTRYPDGVPFKVTDKRTIHFKDKRSGVFQGSGQMLGGETKPSRLVPSNLDKSTNTKTPDTETQVETHLPGPKLTMEQFLNKLPVSVMKEGKVVDIRSSVGKTIKGGSRTTSDITVIETNAVKEIRNRLDLQEKDRPPSARDITTLRIKSENGNLTYILKMKFTDTIGDVRQHLIKQRSCNDTSFEIRSAFPNKVFNDDKVTLQKCGLVPNATLHLRPKT